MQLIIIWILLFEVNFSLTKDAKQQCYETDKNSKKGMRSSKARFQRSAYLYGFGESKQKQTGQCSTWGSFHFRTFDGEVFRFPGQCNYLFAAHCKKPFEDFNIQIQQSFVNSIPTITQISVKIQGLVLELIGHSATVNGIQLDLPYSHSAIQIEQRGKELKITAKMMLSLIWHDDSSLHLILNKKYMGWTCGLCGDYDGDQSNDLFYKESLLQPIEFGTLHKFRKPEQDCVDPKPEPKDQCIIFRALCLKLLRNSKWKQCNRLVDPDPYIEAYMHDMCICNSSVKYSSFCLCSTIAEYSRQCAVVGGKPPDWRSPEMCYLACPYNLIYKECSSPCAPTCSNPGRQFFCDGTCVSGCVCPTGLVLDDITNSGCVPLKSCPCIFNNDVYLPGSYYHAPCFSCLCSGGHWTCKDLPCPSSCSVEGGSHITTFDKARYTFHGKCIYIFAKSCADNAFLVTIEMQKCAYEETATCLKRVFLFLDKGKAIFEIKYDNSDFPHVEFDEREMAEGLCGNFNDIQKDDFRSSSGAVEANVVDFANTWKTQYSCKNVKPVLEHPCSYGMEIEKYAHFWCNILINKEGPFADCHTAVNPDPYRQNCLFDTCSCRRTEDCMCAAVSSYVWACAAVGIKMAGWREEVCKNYVSYCPPSLVYSYTVTSCIPTCRSLTEPDLACSIKFFTIDGCVCPKGTYLNENGMCVVKEDCPCYYKGIPITFDNPLHVGRLICTCTNGQIDCTEQEIPVCPPPFIYFDCEKVGEHSKGSECPNTCHTSNAQCYSPLCVSGCMCPKGLVLNDDGTCIYDSECPCFHNGVSYKTGDKMIFRCNNCVCNNRTWVCDNKADMGVCTVYGEGHYITFDSKRYTINGDCEYTLVQDFCDIHNLKKGTFKVITENVPCGTTGTSCSKTIIIYLGGHKLILSDGSWEVVQTSSEIDTAYKVRNMGLFLVVETTNGLVIKWDRMTSIFIYLSISFKGKVCGLCGNFDGNRNNDFTTRSKCVVEDATEFRDSWKVSPSCPEVYISKDPCSINPHRVSWAQKRCTVINSNVFSKCHSEVDPEKYYEACLRDTCACDIGGDCNCYCTAISAYAQACSEACVCIDWRTPTICPLFCDFYNKQRKCEWSYKPCGAPCMKTCRNPSGTCLHHLKGLEGCYPMCPENKPFFNEDEMQCVAQCGCLDTDDNYYKLGAKVESCNICESCMCTEKGILCYYDKNACYCEFQGNILEIGETIQIEDDLQRCIIVKCGVNGTTTYPCYSTTTGITGPYTISAGFSKATTGPSKLPTSEVSSKGPTSSILPYKSTKSPEKTSKITSSGVKLSTVPTPSKSSVLSSKGPLTAEETSKVSTTSAGPSEMATSAFRTVTKTAKPTINTSLAKTSSAQNATSGIPSMKSTMSKKSSGFTTKSTRLPTVETNPTKSSSFPISSSETVLSPEVPFEVTTSKATTGPSKLPTSEVSSKGPTSSILPYKSTKSPEQTSKITSSSVKLSTVPTPSKSSVLSSKGPLTAEETSKVSTTSAGPSEMATSAFRAVTKTAKPTINTSLAKTSSAQNATSGIPSMKSTMSKKSSGFTTKSTRLPTVETNPTKSSSFPISSSETVLSPEVPFEVTTSKATTGPSKLPTSEVSSKGPTSSILPYISTKSPEQTSKITSSSAATLQLESSGAATSSLNFFTKTSAVSTVPTSVIYSTEKKVSGSSAITSILVKSSSIPYIYSRPTIRSTFTPTILPTAKETLKVLTPEVYSKFSTAAGSSKIPTSSTLPYKSPPSSEETAIVLTSSKLAASPGISSSREPLKHPTQPQELSTVTTFSSTMETSNVSSFPIVHTTTKTETTGYFILKTTLVKLSTVPTPSKSSVLSSKGPLTAEETSKVSTTSAGPSEMATSAFRAVTKTAKPTINTSLAKTSSAQNATSGIPSMKSTMSKKSSGTKSTRLPTVETNPTKSSSFPISSSETVLSPEVPFEVTTSPTELTKKANESLSTTKTNALQTEKDFGQYTSILTITSGKPDAIQKPYFSKCVNVTCYENGQLNVESVKCPLLKDVTCNDGKPPMKVYDQDGCCFYYECRTCMGFNGKIRKLGETWQEHCQECTCDKETAKIICMPTECPQLDYSKCSKPWLEPFLLLTENDRCCGSIECRCSPSKCNTTLGDCPLGYEHVNISSDDCCIIYECRPLDVCMVEGAVYQVGNPVWTSASSCLECKCTDRKDLESGFNIVDCNPILCMMNCPQGFYYQKSDNMCCGQCVQVSCPVKDEYGTIYLIQPGETQVLSNDNCTHYTCENIDGRLITSSQKQICSELNEEECEPNSIMKEQNGCCNVCRVPKACSVQTKQTLVSYNGCSANVTLSYCTGVCPSFQEFSVDKLSMDRTCGCCQELEAEEQNINLTCPDGESNISFNITNVRRCGCTSTECTPLNPTILYQNP